MFRNLTQVGPLVLYAHMNRDGIEIVDYICQQCNESGSLTGVTAAMIFDMIKIHVLHKGKTFSKS